MDDATTFPVWELDAEILVARTGKRFSVHRLQVRAPAPDEARSSIINYLSVVLGLSKGDSITATKIQDCTEFVDESELEGWVQGAFGVRIRQ